MITDLRRRLGRGHQPVEASPEPALVAEPAPERVELELAGYAEDCRIFGFVDLDTDRLTDYLNAREQFELRDVLLVALEDGRASEAKSLTVERHELLAVRGSGPRGNLNRRGRTRPYPMTLQTGPYTIHGHLHGLPGADPLKALRLRRTMVPLTESWIEYRADDDAHRARVGTIIVNREMIDWIRTSTGDELRLPNLSVETKPDPHAKDLTGYIRTNRE
jgi:hypothetical protein